MANRNRAKLSRFVLVRTLNLAWNMHSEWVVPRGTGHNRDMESPKMTREINTNIGELISLFYQEFLELYGDEELASVAAATVITDLLSVEPAESEAALIDAA